MSHIEVREERCKGCLLCAEVCPKHVIDQAERFNQQGYKVAELKDEKVELCTGCAFCAEVCPEFAIAVWRSVKEKKKGGGA